MMPGSQGESAVARESGGEKRLQGSAHAHRCPTCFIVSAPCSCYGTSYWSICQLCREGRSTQLEMRVAGPGHIPTRTHADDAGLDLYTYVDPEIGRTQESINIHMIKEKGYKLHWKDQHVNCIPENFDFATFSIDPGRFLDIDTGIAVELPGGFWADIVGRSSTIRKRGLMVPVGVIDTGFRGRLFVPVYNISRDTVQIHHGDRIGQLVLHPNITARVEVRGVDWLNTDTERGEAGFGSSGK